MLSRCPAPATMARLSPWLLAILLALATSPPMSTASRETCRAGYQRPHPQGVCGAALTNILEHICQYVTRGSRFARYMQKRAAEQRSEEVRDLLLNKRDAFSYLQKRSSNNRPVTLTCACCYDRCTVLEIAQYCPVSGGRRRRTEQRSSGASETALTSDQSSFDDEYN